MGNNKNGTKLKLRREYLGVTQNSLAKKVGVDKQVIYNWEKGGSQLKQIKTAISIAKALDDSVENLFS